MLKGEEDGSGDETSSLFRGPSLKNLSDAGVFVIFAVSEKLEVWPRF